MVDLRFRARPFNHLDQCHYLKYSFPEDEDLQLNFIGLPLHLLGYFMLHHRNLR